jgi:hypothetical protein
MARASPWTSAMCAACAPISLCAWLQWSSLPLRLLLAPSLPLPLFCHRCLACHHRPPPSHLRTQTHSVDATPTTARVPTTFPNHEPSTSTTGRHPSLPFPSAHSVPPWKPPSGEPPSSPVTKSGPLPHRPSLQPTTPPHRAAAHQNWCRRQAPWWFPCLGLGLGCHGREGLWPSGLSPFQ